MKKYITIVALAVITMTLSNCIGAGNNSMVKASADNHFPTLTGIDLEGEEQIIPKSFVGKINLVAVAFEREHQTLVNTWIPIADELIKQHASVQFYEIPLIYELNPAARFWINNGMRSGIQDDIARKRTITVYTDRDKFTSLLNMKTDTIYMLVLDDAGKILWQTEGAATPETQAQLQQFIASKR